jgi:hypothetical protein
MPKKSLSKKTTPKSIKEDKSSNFSRFFREATYEEKRKVFLEVAKAACEEQRKVMQGVKTAN